MVHSASNPPPGPLATPLPVIVEGYFGPVSGELTWLQRDRLAFWTPMALPGDATLVLRMPLPNSLDTSDVLLQPEVPTSAENSQGTTGFLYAGSYHVLSPDTMRRLRRALRRGSKAPRVPPQPAPPAVLAPAEPPAAPSQPDPPDALLLKPRMLDGAPVTLGVTVPDHADLSQSLAFRGLTVTLTVASLDWLAVGEPVGVLLFLPSAAVIPLSGEVSVRWRDRMALSLRVRPGRDLLSLVAATERNALPRG